MSWFGRYYGKSMGVHEIFKNASFWLTRGKEVSIEVTSNNYVLVEGNEGG